MNPSEQSNSKSSPSKESGFSGNLPLLHMINATLVHLGELQRRLVQLHEANGISDSYKKEKITEWATLTVRLLACIEPALEIAHQEFPEYKDFITSCCDTITKMKEAQGIKGNICKCRGCAPSEATIEAAVAKAMAPRARAKDGKGCSPERHEDVQSKS